MMRAQSRASLSRGASAYSDLSGNIKCDRQAEEFLRDFWNELADGAPLPPELRGLADGAQGRDEDEPAQERAEHQEADDEVSAVAEELVSRRGRGERVARQPRDT